MRHLSALFALSIGAISVAEAQTPGYTVEFLGAKPPSLDTFWAVDVNDAGVVVGRSYESGYKRGWVAVPGQGVEILPIPPDTVFSETYDVNEAGVIAGGLYLDSGLSRGVIWKPGPGGYEIYFLPEAPGGTLPPFDARAINDHGDVVGKLGVLSGSYVWNEATGTVQIPTSTFPVPPDALNEQRQIAGDSYRMDLDTMVLEVLGSPTGTSYNYIYTRFEAMNDAGECVGYSVVATSGWPYLATRYTDPGVWKLYNVTPLITANALDISATGDTVYQLGSFGSYVSVEGFGSLGFSNLVAPTDSDWDVSGSFLPAISRGGKLAMTGSNTITGQAGVVLLSPRGFEDLGGGTPGALGTPVLTAYGSLVEGEPTRLRLASAATSSTAFLAWSSSSSPTPLFGGTVHANPADFVVALPTSSLGRFDVTFTWPTLAPGAGVYLQAGVVDLEAAGFVALSNGLRAETD